MQSIQLQYFKPRNTLNLNYLYTLFREKNVLIELNSLKKPFSCPKKQCSLLNKMKNVARRNKQFIIFDEWTFPRKKNPGKKKCQQIKQRKSPPAASQQAVCSTKGTNRQILTFNFSLSLSLSPAAAAAAAAAALCTYLVQL